MIPTSGKAVSAVSDAAGSPAAENGAYYGPRNGYKGPTALLPLPRSARRSDAAALWEAAEKLTGTSLPTA